MAESAAKMYALASVLIIIAIVTVLMRFYARSIKKAKFEWDDYLILPALLTTIATGTCIYVGTALGHLGQHTSIDADSGMPLLDRHTTVFLQLVYVSQLTQTLTFGFTKMAVLLFYRRIFKGQIFIAAVWTMLVICSTWMVVFFFANLFQCWPISMNWYGLGGPPDHCINTTIMYLAQAWSDVFTDIMILSIPIPCIWSLQMRVIHKISVLAMFLLGYLVVAAGVTKLVTFRNIAYDTSASNLDITYVLTPVVYWPMVESSLGIAGACLPLTRPIFTDMSNMKLFDSIRGFMSRVSFQSSKHDHGFGTPSSPSKSWNGVDYYARPMAIPDTPPSSRYCNSCGQYYANGSVEETERLTASRTTKCSEGPCLV